MPSKSLQIATYPDITPDSRGGGAMAWYTIDGHPEAELRTYMQGIDGNGELYFSGEPWEIAKNGESKTYPIITHLSRSYTQTGGYTNDFTVAWVTERKHHSESLPPFPPSLGAGHLDIGFNPFNTIAPPGNSLEVNHDRTIFQFYIHNQRYSDQQPVWNNNRPIMVSSEEEQPAGQQIVDHIPLNLSRSSNRHLWVRTARTPHEGRIYNRLLTRDVDSAGRMQHDIIELSPDGPEFTKLGHLSAFHNHQDNVTWVAADLRPLDGPANIWLWKITTSASGVVTVATIKSSDQGH